MDHTSDLERRLDRLESRLEIQQLVTRYCVVVDDRDLDALAQLFTEDAWFDSVGGRTTGREALVEYYAGRLERYGPTYHYPHGQVVDFEGSDRATGTVLAHAELAIQGEAFVVGIRYRDEYAREDGRWRFRSRDLGVVYAMRLADLPHGIGDRLRKRWPGSPPEAADWPEGNAAYEAFVDARPSR